MALSPRLEVRQSQSLTLTPQLMQSIRLLQLSHLELNAFVEAELLRNPLLEREDGGEGGDPAETPIEVSPFEETIDLDLAQFLYLETPSRRDVHDLSEHLKDIVATLRKLTWSRGGLLTVSRAEADEIEAERRREIEERRAGDNS